MGFQNGFRSRHPEKPVLKVDDAFIRIQFILPYIIQIRIDMLQCFIHFAHLDKFLIIISNILFDASHHHVVCIEAIAAIIIYIFQKCLPAVIPYKNILHMFPYILCKKRNADIRLRGLFIEFDECRMLHHRLVKYPMTRFDSQCYRRFTVIVPLPLIPVKF